MTIIVKKKDGKIVRHDDYSNENEKVQSDRPLRMKDVLPKKTDKGMTWGRKSQKSASLKSNAPDSQYLEHFYIFKRSFKSKTTPQKPLSYS